MEGRRSGTRNGDEVMMQEPQFHLDNRRLGVPFGGDAPVIGVLVPLFSPTVKSRSANFNGTRGVLQVTRGLESVRLLGPGLGCVRQTVWIFRHLQVFAQT